MVASLNGTPTTSGPMAYQGPQLPARFFFPGLNLANDYNMRGRSATSSSALSTVPNPWSSKPRAISSAQVYTPTQPNINHGLGQVFQSHASQPTSHLRDHNPPLDISSIPQGAGFRQQITIGHQINAFQRHPGRQVSAQTNLFAGANGAAYSGPPYSGLRQLADHSLVHGISSSSSFPDVSPYQVLPSASTTISPPPSDWSGIAEFDNTSPSYARNNSDYHQAVVGQSAGSDGVPQGDIYEETPDSPAFVTQLHHGHQGESTADGCLHQGEAGTLAQKSTSEQNQESFQTSSKVRRVEPQEATGKDVRAQRDSKPRKQPKMRPSKGGPKYNKWGFYAPPSPTEPGTSTTGGCLRLHTKVAPPVPSPLPQDYQQVQPAATQAAPAAKPKKDDQPSSTCCPASTTKTGGKRKRDEEAASREFVPGSSSSEPRTVKRRRTQDEMAAARREKGEKAMYTHVDDSHSLSIRVNLFRDQM